jgi:hypothetical protein
VILDAAAADSRPDFNQLMTPKPQMSYLKPGCVPLKSPGELARSG